MQNRHASVGREGVAVAGLQGTPDPAKPRVLGRQFLATMLGNRPTQAAERRGRERHRSPHVRGASEWLSLAVLGGPQKQETYPESAGRACAAPFSVVIVPAVRSRARPRM